MSRRAAPVPAELGAMAAEALALARRLAGAAAAGDGAAAAGDGAAAAGDGAAAAGDSAAASGDGAVAGQMLDALAGALCAAAAASGPGEPDAAARTVAARTVAAQHEAAAREVAEWAAGAAAWAQRVALPDPLGWLYLTLQGRGRRRSQGAFYTPPEVAAYLCRRALSGLPAGARVLDPACGSGTFLLAARAAAGGTVALEGWEADGTAADLARRRLALAGIRAEVRQADALACDGPPAYDAVIGNPPYLGSGLRGLASWPAEQRRRLIERFPAAEYKLNLYGLFVEQGLRLLRPGGRLAFVLPDSFLLGRYFARLRQALLGQARLLELALVLPNLWPDGVVGRSVLLVAERGSAAPGHRVAVRLIRDLADLADSPPARPADASEWPQADWGARPPWRFRLFFSADDAAWVRRLEAHPQVVPLGRVLQTYSGLIGRAGQRSLLRSTYPGDRVEVRRGDHLLYAGTPASDRWRPLLRSGAEIDRYAVRWAGEQVLWEPALFKSGGRAALYRGPKLLLRQTADRLVAAYDASGLACLNNIHLLVRRNPDDRHDLRYWLALLNSRLLGRYYRLTALEAGRIYPQVDLDMLAELPLRAIDFSLAADRSAHDDLVRLAQAREQARDASGAAALDDAIEAQVERLYGAAPGGPHP